MTELLSTSRHIPVLNSLRAIAALSVCLFHFVCTVTGFISNQQILHLFSFGHYGVQMFFVISGFIIPWSMYHSKYRLSNFFTFTAKRLIRLEPPYLLSLMLAIIHTYVRVLSPHYNGVDITPTLKQIVLHFGYLIPFFETEKWIRPVYWTLAIEFQYYIAIGLSFNFIFSLKMGQRIICYLLCLGAPFIIKTNFLPYHLPVFLLGIVLCMYKVHLVKINELWIVALVSFVVIFYCMDTPTVVFSAVTFLVILYAENVRSRIGDFLGDISYSLYLFHSLSGMIILNYFAHSASMPIFKALLIIVAVMVSICFSFLIYKLIEKPSKQLSSRISYKRKPS
jgi:peptidoglycan/LPS O-acetylase OafA/YrhL